MTSPVFDSCEARRNVLPSGQSTQPLSSSSAVPCGRGGGEIEIERVQGRDAGFGALEVSRDSAGLSTMSCGRTSVPWSSCAARG